MWNPFKKKEEIKEVVIEEAHLSTKEKIMYILQSKVMFEDRDGNTDPKGVMFVIYEALGERNDRTLAGLTDEEVLEKLKSII